MTTEEAKHKLDFMKKAYQKLIDEKVDSGKLVGDGVRGEWKAEAPLDEAYKDMIGALEMAIKALEQTRWIPCTERLPEKDGCYLVTYKWKGSYSGDTYVETTMAEYREKPKDWEWDCKGVIAWMLLPKPYKAESEEGK